MREANELQPRARGGWCLPPLTPELLSFRKHKILMRQLDKLLEIAANENKLTKHELEIDGHDLTFWSKPMTIADYQAAKKASKDPDDMLETTARLFIKKAMDEGGSPQYQTDALPVLLRVLSMATASKILGAMNSEEEEDDEVELDIKSPEGAAKKGVKSPN